MDGDTLGGSERSYSFKLWRPTGLDCSRRCQSPPVSPEHVPAVCAVNGSPQSHTAKFHHRVRVLDNSRELHHRLSRALCDCNSGGGERGACSCRSLNLLLGSETRADTVYEPAESDEHMLIPPAIDGCGSYSCPSSPVGCRHCLGRAVTPVRDSSHRLHTNSAARSPQLLQLPAASCRDSCRLECRFSPSPCCRVGSLHRLDRLCSGSFRQLSRWWSSVSLSWRPKRQRCDSPAVKLLVQRSSDCVFSVVHLTSSQHSEL